MTRLVPHGLFERLDVVANALEQDSRATAGFVGVFRHSDPALYNYTSDALLMLETSTEIDSATADEATKHLRFLEGLSITRRKLMMLVFGDDFHDSVSYTSGDFNSLDRAIGGVLEGTLRFETLEQVIEAAVEETRAELTEVVGQYNLQAQDDPASKELARSYKELRESIAKAQTRLEKTLQGLWAEFLMETADER